jgi:RHS repeat-associated protein
MASTDRHWLHTDEQGSVVASSDDSGAGTIYVYSPTGEPLGGFSGSGQIFRYTGQAQLAAAELYYYKARMYDPGLGRFLQTDPAGYSAGMNLYAYVMNNYPNGSDPSGMCDSSIDANGVEEVCSGGVRDPVCSLNLCLTIVDPGTGFITSCSIPDMGCIIDAPLEQKVQRKDTNTPENLKCEPWRLGPCKTDPANKETIKFVCGSSAAEAVLKTMRFNTAIGLAYGAYSGFVYGEILGGWATLGSSGLAGAAGGATILGTLGAMRGVFMGAMKGMACQAAGAYSK